MSVQKQEFESYEFITDWKCPNCNKVHSKPHFAFPNQVDETKKAGTVGRIKEKFRRENADGTGNDVTCDEYVSKEGTGPVKINDKQAPLFCSHCGWVDELIYFSKIKTKKKHVR